MVTQRWVTADLSYTDGPTTIDHYNVRARYKGPQAGQEQPGIEILPMTNCRAGVTDIQPNGWIVRPMYFAAPLCHGESVFFASRVKYRTNIPAYPAFLQVTSFGILSLIMRVQFGSGVVPELCWVYGGPNAAEASNVPDESEDSRWRAPNQLGYLEYHTENCPPAWCYAIGWKWDDA
jgi:hypothetical protein